MIFENTKCECGHQNPVGTVLCESCGKPLENTESSEPLEMRYDGAARRSQKANPSLLDKVWNFFSSVKIAVYLIFFTLLASSLGTIFPQESTFLNMDPSTFYKAEYGTLGEIYYKLGLSHTYESWWFILLLFMIGTSLVICSLDRVLPLYKALSKQQIRKHLSFINRQRAGLIQTMPFSEEDGEAQEWVNKLGKQLRKQRFRVHTEGAALLAEKNRFSRWGPYILHIGLIIFLLAVVMRSIPGWHMDKHMGFLEGVPVKIPDTSYYLKNEQFTVDYYKPEEMSEEFREKNRSVAKLYETQAVLYRCTDRCDDDDPVLEEVHRQKIEVNKPLDYKGLLAYQFDFQETPTILSMDPKVRNLKTGEAFGPIHLNMNNPAQSYDAGPYHLELKGYFKDFGMDDKGQPITQSNSPNAPAFIFQVTGPDLPAQGSVFMYFPRQIDQQNFRQDAINGELAKTLAISVDSMDDVQIAAYTSYLNIRMDRAMPFIWVGSAIGMIGLVMTFYWQHRRIWLRLDGRELSLGAHTNKNWYGLRREIATSLTKIGMPIEQKALDKGGTNG
ncbi:cytochrome c biogenesis protein ResB [Paenibacillus sp. J31TS4]|nr:cytochrome c biogenesis protein ResB [Paenibacillus sp. J31TS4]